jgi:hypothetical protein
MNIELFSDFDQAKIFLRKMRNDIVGSVENKAEYIKNNSFTK